MKTKTLLRNFGTILLVAILCFYNLDAVQAQVDISPSLPYSQNFNTLPVSGSATWSNGVTLPGWYIGQVKSQNNNLTTPLNISANTGTGAATGAFSFGPANNSDRALGGKEVGNNNGYYYYGLRMKNTSGSTIQSFTITYTVKKFNTTSSNFNFNYRKVDASSTITSIAPYATSWIAVPTLSVSTSTTLTITKTINDVDLEPNGEIMFRWQDATTKNTGVAGIDDVTISASSKNVFYNVSGTSITNTSWFPNTDGTGDAPISFSKDNQEFIVLNSQNPSLGSALTISGSNSKLIVGNGTNTVSLTIPTGSALTAMVDVQNNATLNIANATPPTLGTLGNGSTVSYTNSTTPITPTTYGNLIIAASKTLSTATVTVNGQLTVNTGNTFTQTGGTLNITGSLNSATGTYSFTGGTVVFDAPSGTQNVPGLSYYNLTIAGAGTRQLLANATVKGVLNFNGPQLVAAEPITLTLDNAGSITNETPTSCFKGKLVKSEIINGAADRTFGGMGLRFVNTTGNWGAVTVTRTTDAYQKNPKDDTKQSIKRSWNIQPSTQAGTNVNLTFNWLTSEDNGQNYGSPTMQAQPWKSTDGGTTWIPVGNLVTITTNGDVRTASVTTNSFSVWTWSGTNNPLPVTWLSYNGKATENGNLLTWATASEKNSENFIVERSENGKTFEAIGTVKAAGNSSQVLNYQFTDKHPLTNATAYYRLKQTDTDGAYDYSAIIAIAKNDRFVQVLNAYPNPFGQTIHLQLAEGHTAKKVVLLTLEGKEVYSKVLTSETETVLNDLPELKAGIYFLQLTGENETTTLKVMRQ